MFSIVAEFFRGLELHSRGCKEEVFGYALAGPEADQTLKAMGWKYQCT